LGEHFKIKKFHVRQRWGAAIWRAQTQVLLGRLKYALAPGWEEAESRRAGRTQRRRPAAGRTLVGLVLEAPTQTADSWGAGYGGDVGRADRYAGG
jgi:hypothetical protein